MTEFVMVRGVVYRRVSAETKWWRCSVPPDGAPGVRSKWPPCYTNAKLPAHELIDAAQAKAAMEESLKRLERGRAR